MNTSDLSGKHIVITANTAWCIYHFRGSLVRALLRHGCRVTIVSPYDKYVDAFLEKGCDFVEIKMDRHSLSVIKDFGLLKNLGKALADLRPDAVIGYTIKNNIYGAIASRRLNIPFIAVVPGLGNAFAKQGVLQAFVVRLYRFAFRKVHRVLFSNEDDKSVFVRNRIVDVAKCVALDGEGVDLDHYGFEPLPDGQEPITFLFCARLLHSKGVADFVAAAKRIQAKHPAVRFNILGKLAENHPDGISQKTLDEWIAQGCVTYLGVTPDVRPYIGQSHCVVLPSYYQEGMSRILLDAIATGRPVITTDMPGCRETVLDGETGFLTYAKDPVHLAGCMAKIVGMPREELEAMAVKGRALAENRFDDKTRVRSYVEMLATLFQRT